MGGGGLTRTGGGSWGRRQVASKEDACAIVDDCHLDDIARMTKTKVKSNLNTLQNADSASHWRGSNLRRGREMRGGEGEEVHPGAAHWGAAARRVGEEAVEG